MSTITVKTLFLLCIIFSTLFCDEIDDLKVEIQQLKEKITTLNNRVPLIKSEGLGFSIGFPTGLYNDDHLYGLELGYFFKNHLGIRADIHFLGNNDNDFYQFIALPSIGILGKSPLFYNFHTYGGIFLGGSQELNGTKKGPYFHIRGFGGIEFITSKKVCFFMEFGGGGIVSDAVVNYTRGTLISGGSRIYF